MFALSKDGLQKDNGLQSNKVLAVQDFLVKREAVILYADGWSPALVLLGSLCTRMVAAWHTY